MIEVAIVAVLIAWLGVPGAVAVAALALVVLTPIIIAPSDRRLAVSA